MDSMIFKGTVPVFKKKKPKKGKYDISYKNKTEVMKQGETEI
jgi:hypothetical protein